ncbi:MAG: hypothetical protein DLM70_11755 [Chloroflexi bacterium]|nr:MAG: hypothetical protein DLM70_11755 [Chloroflexota bacterium]
MPRLHGAYLVGSVNWLCDGAPFPATSDLDVNLVLTGPDSPPNREKFVYSRCLKVLHHDAPVAMQDRFEPAYRWLLGEYGYWVAGRSSAAQRTRV